MSRYTIEKALVVLALYVLISVIAGAFLVARGIAPFSAGFVLTFVAAVFVRWLLKGDS